MTGNDDGSPQDRPSVSLLYDGKPERVDAKDDRNSGPLVSVSRHLAIGAISGAFLLGICIASIAWIAAGGTFPEFSTPTEREANTETIARREAVQLLKERLDAQSATVAPPVDMLLAEGDLRPASAIHRATGHVELWQNAEGQRVLRLEGLAVTGNVALVVRLVRSQRFENADDIFGADWSELGALQSSSRQEFAVPPDLPVDQPLHAIIWNAPYGLEFGSALLEPASKQ